MRHEQFKFPWKDEDDKYIFEADNPDNPLVEPIEGTITFIITTKKSYARGVFRIFTRLTTKFLDEYDSDIVPFMSFEMDLIVWREIESKERAGSASEPAKTETNFLEWLSQAAIFVNYARYGQLGGHGFVCASRYDDYDGALQKAVEDLDGGDIEALEAAQIIEDMECWYANHPDPAEAMQQLVSKLRSFYFDKLNP